MRIGNLELKYGICLAPMAGFSDRGMRYVSHMLGAEYSVSEMISAKAVCYKDRKTFELARISEDEGPVAIQIFGSDPNTMARASEILQKDMASNAKPVAIDINMGCPVHKIFSNGEGSALMKNPDEIYRIVKAVNSASDIPVTVKIRAGIDKEHINAVECALAAEAGGAAAVCVHGRTRVDMYSGKADLEIIKNVKQSLQIPVIANGDIVDFESARKMFLETKADAIMIGRGAIGNPFVFSEILAGISGEKFVMPSREERINTALLQLKLSAQQKGERAAVLEARKQVALYLKGFPGAAAARAEINRSETYLDVERALMLSL